MDPIAAAVKAKAFPRLLLSSFSLPTPKPFPELSVQAFLPLPLPCLLVNMMFLSSYELSGPPREVQASLASPTPFRPSPPPRSRALLASQGGRSEETLLVTQGEIL